MGKDIFRGFPRPATTFTILFNVLTYLYHNCANQQYFNACDPWYPGRVNTPLFPISHVSLLTSPIK